MGGQLARQECIELLSSHNPFKNSQALVALMESRDFSEDFVALAREIETKDDTVAFHIRISSIARAYLHLAGICDDESVDEETAYVLSAFGAIPNIGSNAQASEKGKSTVS